MAQGMLPSFFKILIDPSRPYLPLPPDFVQKHLKNKKIPEDSILQSVNGGYSWSLKIRKVDEDYSFVDGWNKVVEDTRLVLGDLLVFWLVDHSTFKVLIFGKNGCPKIFPSKIMVQLDEEGEEEEEGDEEEEEKDEGDKNEKDPFFKTTISKCHNCHLRFPSKFTRLAGLDKERTIRMKNLDGKEWSVSLRSESPRQTRYYLSAGWNEFRKANHLSEGDKCVFEYIRSEDKLSLATLTKVRAPVSVNMKRPRGQHPRVDVVKRPPGRPPKKRSRGRPPLVEVARKDSEAEVVRRSVGRPVKRKKGGPAL